MPTANVTVDHDWTLVAHDASTKVSVSCRTPCFVEFATTGSDETDPTVEGHCLEMPKEQITRNWFPVGAIYAKIVSSSPDSTTFVVDESV